jgi:hypothetical protein
MAALFTSYNAAPCDRDASVARTARHSSIGFAALFARLWDGTLEFIVFLWAVGVSAFFGLIAAGFLFG